MAMSRVILGIPVGDPAGIGPEVALKAVSEPAVQRGCVPVLVGQLGLLRRVAAACDLSLALQPVDESLVGLPEALGTVPLLEVGDLDPSQVRWGAVQSSCGQAAYSYVEAAVKLALAGRIQAMATAPINKQAWKQAGVSAIGHTELLGQLCGVEDPLTMFEVRDLRIFFLTRHVPLRQACELVTRERVYQGIVRCTAALDALGVAAGPLAVAGLNPHCGEHGLIGTEEAEAIEPAVQRARAEGWAVDGPIGADSVFHLARGGRYRAVLSLYHDQGHIAAKTLDFERTVAVTTGLPFIRTSVDHGTAFDIAGTATASATSMIEAILVAAKYSGAMR